jgi:hypothetical protein
MPKFKTPMSKQAQSPKSKSPFENMLLLFCLDFDIGHFIHGNHLKE